MRIVIAGLGSIGLRHLRNIRELVPDATIVALRHTAGGPPVPGVNRVVTSLDEAAAWAPDAAFVCGPTRTHAPFAQRFIEAGAHVFVEKPIADELDAAHRLIEAARCRARVLMVGYNLRFDPGLNAAADLLRAGTIGRLMSVRAEVGQFLPDWRPGSDYRTSASARAADGGGVALELSHEFDYVRWLCGDIVEAHAFSGRLSDLDIDVEDTAEVVLKFAGGELGSIHLDMTQHAATRTLRLVGTSGTIVWDAVAGNVRWFTAHSRRWHEAALSGADRNAMYVAEVREFLACIAGGTQPRVTGADGVAALRLALQVRGRPRSEPVAH